MFQWRFQFQTLSIVSFLNFFLFAVCDPFILMLLLLFFNTLGLCSRTARPDGDTRNPRYTWNPRNPWTTRATRTRRVFWILTSMEAVCLDVWVKQGWQGLWSCSRKEMFEGKTVHFYCLLHNRSLCRHAMLIREERCVTTKKNGRVAD